jgi:hypothetical protein
MCIPPKRANIQEYFDVHDNIGTLTYRQVVEKIAKKHRWIVQLNGPNLDTYCCKQCAE